VLLAIARTPDSRIASRGGAMPERKDPSAVRWLIGGELANYRREAALTQADVTRGTGISKAKLSSMESGRYQQSIDDVKTLLTHYGVGRPDIDRVVGLASEPNTHTWWTPWRHVIPEWLRTFVGLEGMATAEFVYEPGIVPGLLQIADYAAAVTNATNFVRPDHMERFISFRVARAARLFEEPALHLHTVFGEGALRLRVGDDDLLRAQYEHLVKMASRNNITIQIARPEDGVRSAVSGQFAVLEFDRSRPIAYTELLDDAVYVQHQEKVTTYRTVQDRMKTAALSPEDSMALIDSLLKGLS
jgi:DNA-binding XRE family transcriptional regulator